MKMQIIKYALSIAGHILQIILLFYYTKGSGKCWGRRCGCGCQLLKKENTNKNAA